MFAPPKTYVTKGASKPVAQSQKKVPSTKIIKEKMIENDHDTFHVATVDLQVGTRMRALRAEKEWTQKDLAMRVNIKQEIVRDYENGKAIPDPKLMARFEAVLGGSIRHD